MTERVILAYGDSNTHGTMPMATLEDQGRFAPAERWPGVCARALGSGWRVIEEGLPGRTTVHPDPIEGAHKNGLAILPAILETHRPIDLVVLMLGTNDLKQRFSVTPLDVGISVSKLLDALGQSRSGPKSDRPRLLVVAPMPIEEVGCLAGMFEGGAAKSRRLAAEVARVAALYGADFLNAGEVITVSEIDGIHFDAAAHAALGRAIAAKISEMSL
jgi:lysophospholipase L1-like esterase